MKHNPKNWTIIALVQLAIIISSFNLPNNIINGATWYAPIIDFGRIALLFGIPIFDAILVTKLLAIGKQKKTYLKQFIDASDRIRYESIAPIYFVNFTSKQIDSIELAFKHSRNDLVFDTSFPFELLQHHLKGKNKNV
jgi:hypothetical protein